MFHAHGYEKGSKLTRLEVWTRIADQTGKQFDELLNKPKLTPKNEYLWHEYSNIKKGCDDVNYQSISAYTQLTGAELTPFEVELMIDIDFTRKRSEVSK